jgi:hypothetical protein
MQGLHAMQRSRLRYNHTVLTGLAKQASCLPPYKAGLQEPCSALQVFKICSAFAQAIDNWRYTQQQCHLQQTTTMQHPFASS